MKTTNCPACGVRGVGSQSYADLHARGGARRMPVGTCDECGWSSLLAIPRRDWHLPEHLPRPLGMSAEEFGFRASLFVLWKTRPASEFVSQLRIFADWLTDQGRAEEVAARADWQVYGAKGGDPKGWWQWTAPAGAGWVEIETVREFRAAHWSGVDRAEYNPPAYQNVKYINDDRAKLTKSMHNGRYFLCWPPGFMRITGPLYHNAQRWRITVQPRRLVGSCNSRPVERVWPAGYTTLLLPFESPQPNASTSCAPAVAEDLGLFAEVEDAA